MRTALGGLFVACALIGSSALISACAEEAVVAPPPPPPSPPPLAAPPPEEPVKLDAITRVEFNRYAVELDVPLFWAAGSKNDGAIEASNLVILWRAQPSDRRYLDDKGAFTDGFFDAYRAMVLLKKGATKTAALDPAERARRDAVLAELGQGRPSLVSVAFTPTTPQDRAIIDHVQRAAAIIEGIYAKQKGTADLFATIAPDDTASRGLFRRNQGPFCEQPKTEKDPNCNASPKHPAKISGLYPRSIQKDPKFCEVLEKRPDEKALLDPFVVVTEDGSGALKPMPYVVAYHDEMIAVSHELRAAAEAVTSPDEQALHAYLVADAQAFLDGDVRPADEAWSKMTSQNSKWYLRVAADEVYADPCSQKAGFHVSFARIDQGSLAWQKKLEPVKKDMEAELARLAGAPYRARQVTFHLPDFIEIMLNAGDSRNATGATIGQSLPNWGPVADEGRGRTVAMTNIATDPDSKASVKEVVSSLFCAPTMAELSLEPEASITDTVLHEASHNLGPSNDYKVKGKTASQLMGGALSSTFEELKAETSACYFADWLVGKNLLTAEDAKRAHVRQVAWAFGHLGDGLYTGDGKQKPYSQLASIQMGTLMNGGALAWHPKETAANGKDLGCFAFEIAKYPAAIAKLEKQVLSIKARGDKAAAEALRVEFADKPGAWKDLRAIIEQRWQRLPKASFVYKASY